ncbi:PilZ domain-containing protein [Bryobacter aggregatus]|uniref:PilZ domain-containing protein n=1 Tax=Bryobacter aggregatus TaxID=360054 RepID=UPI00138DDCC9|nr:PilZ domain-containing protein [Bryobacter aggregatus]
MIEHRKNQRFELRLPFELIRSGHRFNYVHGLTLNLSSSGVLFEADEPVPVGEIIEYFITLPTGQTADEDVRLRCMGKVIRSHDRYSAATMERYEFVRTRPVTTEASAVATASN